MQSTTKVEEISGLASHFTPTTLSSATSEASRDASVGNSGLLTGEMASRASISTHTGPVWDIPALIEREYGTHTSPKRKLKKARSLTAEEGFLSTEVAARFASRLALDHISVLYPDVDTPFSDSIDVVQRLLPYHVFQQPRQNLNVLGRPKGKRKATNPNLVDEIKETKFALECFKRQKVLQDRFRRVKLKAGKRDAPDSQAFALTQIVVEADRAEVASLNTELRNSRLMLDKIQRDKFVTSRQPFYSTAAAPPPYYRNYQYTYAQPYGAVLQSGSSSFSTNTHSSSVGPTTSINDATTTTGAIPVQLPVGSLPALHALGILPVPAASLPPSDQPQPPAVLRGTTGNGTMLSLEINVSLLQQAQMGGLAMVLNSLMSRGANADTPASASAVSSIPTNPEPP